MNRFRAIVSALLTNLTLLSASPITAERLARLHAGATAIEWLPAIAGPAWTLSVAGPDGTVDTHEFPMGAVPKLSLFDQAGQPLADGTYTWELRSLPLQGAKGRVESGSFRILGGEVLAGGQEEPPERRSLSKDQTVADDLIVDGKGCIGLGCSPGEGFLGEALRLKQSVVRLRFEDTSGAAGFPARDWQLTVNDSGSGGADRFSVEDLGASTTPFTLFGGAPSDALVVDSAGRVGLGTKVPTNHLHLKGTTTRLLVENTDPTEANREMFELRNRGGTYFILHDLTKTRYTFALFAGRFIIDDQATAPVEFQVLAGGHIYATSFNLQPSGPESWATNTSGASFQINNQTNPGQELLVGPTGNVSILGAVSATSFDVTSSRDLKEAFTPVDSRAVLAKLADMPLTEWSFKNDESGRRHVGPIAEEFQAAFGLGQDGKSLNLTDVNGVTMAAVKGLHSLVEEQRETIAKQQELIQKLEERLARLEEQQ